MFDLSRGMIVRVKASDRPRESPQRDFLVIENDKINRHSPVVVVVPVTKKRTDRNDPLVVDLGKIQGSPQRESVVDCGLILTIRRELIDDVLDRLNSDAMANVDAALRFSLGLS